MGHRQRCGAWTWPPGSWECRAWPDQDPGYWWRCRVGDRSAVATASGDSQVKFFQVYLHEIEEGPPRCLHQWSLLPGSPHLPPVLEVFRHWLWPHYRAQYSVTRCKKKADLSDKNKTIESQSSEHTRAKLGQYLNDISKKK